VHGLPWQGPNPGWNHKGSIGHGLKHGCIPALESDEGQSYSEIANELGRSKSDIYRVCMTLGCAGANGEPAQALLA